MNQNEDDELEIQHRTLIEEEDLDISKLPNEIKAAMREFNSKLNEYEETGDAELFFELQQDDVAIADDILTFIEDNDDESDDEEDGSYIDEEDEEEEEVRTQSPSANNNQISEMEKSIRANVVDGKISVDDLEKIIKREPDYPNEQVGNLVLKKQYLKPFYEVYER